MQSRYVIDAILASSLRYFFFLNVYLVDIIQRRKIQLGLKFNRTKSGSYAFTNDK
jgi:hypothetical protein